MKRIRHPEEQPKKNKARNSNRVSVGIGTAIVILLAFSCVVGADSFLTDPSVRTEGENYDMVTPDYYSFSENQPTGADPSEDGISDPDSTTGGEVTELTTQATTPVTETTTEATLPETTTTTTTTTATTATTQDPSDPSMPQADAPAEPVSTPTPAPTATPVPSPTPTATPVPTPTPKPVITEEPWEAIFYTIGEVNVRSGPGTEYDIVKTLKPGDAIETVGITSNGWYHTVRDTYVAVSMCTSEPPATPTPVPKASPTPKPTPKPEKKSDPDPTPTPKPEPEPEPQRDAPSKDGMTLVGTDFKITFYGPDYAGPGTDNRTTATGTTCKEGRTVAVDPSVIPTGTQIYIENDPLGGDGYYIAEDTGWGVDGHHIDIFAEDGESMNTLRGYTVYIVN